MAAKIKAAIKAQSIDMVICLADDNDARQRPVLANKAQNSTCLAAGFRIILAVYNGGELMVIMLDFFTLGENV